MSGTFVPVNLDQVLDEFEEQEGCQPYNTHEDHDFSHSEQVSSKPTPYNDTHNHGRTASPATTTEDVPEDLQCLEEKHGISNGEAAPFSSFGTESASQNILLEADPFHNRARNYSEDGSDYSNDSASITDVIAAAEAITGAHDEKLEDRDCDLDLDTGGKETDIISAAMEESDTGIQRHQNQELQASPVPGGEAKSDVASNLVLVAGTQNGQTEGELEYDTGQVPDIGKVSLDEGQNQNLQSKSQLDSIAESKPPDKESATQDALGLDGVSTNEPLSTTTVPVDPVNFETQPVDDSDGDVRVIRRDSDPRTEDSRMDETQPVADHKFDEGTDTSSETTAAVPSNVDATGDYSAKSTGGANCISEFVCDDGSAPSSHKDGNVGSGEAAANWELPSAENYMHTPDNNVKEESELLSVHHTDLETQYPEQVMANMIHDRSNSVSGEADFAEEGASANVIDVEVEAEPVNEQNRTKVKHVGFVLPPTVVLQSNTPTARRISSGESGLGIVPPLWVPDSVASHCMNCGVKFGVIKRKHHCRACGKVLCSACCNMKFSLAYMEGKEGRVCQVCCNALLRAETVSQVTGELNEFPSLSETEEMNEEHSGEPEEMSSTDDQEPSEHDGGTGVLQEFSTEDPEPESSPSLSLPPPLQPTLSAARLQPDDAPPPATPTSPAISEDSDCLFRLDIDHVRSLMPPEKTILPPVMNAVGDSSQAKDKAVLVTENPDDAEVMYKLKGLGETVVFLVNKSLIVKVKIIKLNCCVKKKCWCFVTEGMGGANQEEMVILLECLPKESSIPGDIFSHFNTAYTYAKEGHTVSNLGYTIFGQPFLGSMDNAGFLYIKPTFQCLENIPIPSTPFVFGILIQRPETPWAQLFPLRLMLRLGAEFRYYPCPLWSVRNRPPVYGQIGQTILNLLADFKNFQYTLPPVTGLLVHMAEQQTKLLLPQDRYDEIVKVLNSTDDHVMALGATFSRQADSHLVCMQDGMGYKTQAINIQNLPRKVTGASFIVFTGALKASSPYSAKVNIVEDGILVQLTPEAILELRQALREMHDHSIKIGLLGQQTEEVLLEWVTRIDHTNAGVCSEIDGLSLEQLPSITMHAGADFTRGANLRVQCANVFFMSSGAKPPQFKTDKKLSKMLADLSKAGCKALKRHLVLLSQQGMNKIGLRVNMDADSVGYNVGSNQQPLPADLMADLDNEMVPAVNNAATRYRHGPLVMELVFRILKLF